MSKGVLFSFSYVFLPPCPVSLPSCSAKTIPVVEDDGEAAQVKLDQSIL